MCSIAEEEAIYLPKVQAQVCYVIPCACKVLLPVLHPELIAPTAHYHTTFLLL